jgi:PAS domain S-box-containing protein
VAGSFAVNREILALGVLDRLPEGVVVLDRAGVYRYANRAAARFLNASIPDLVGHSYRDLFPETAGTAFDLAYQRVCETGLVEVFDHFHEPWGVYFRNRIAPMDDGVVIFFSDVTEELTARSEADNSRLLMKQVLDSAPVGIVLQDLEGRFKLVNRFAAARAGHDGESLLGSHTTEVIPQGVADEWRASQAEVIGTGRPQQLDLRLAGADRVTYSYHTVVFPTTDRTGALTGTGSVFSDVTARDLAHEQVVATELRYREMFERAQLGQLVARRDGTLVDVNRAICRMLGYRREELLALKATALVPSHSLSDERKQRLAELGPTGYEYGDQFLRRDGSLLPVQVTVTVMEDPAGEGPLISSIVRDESEVRELNAARERALEQLREAHALVLRFEALVEASPDFVAITDLAGQLTYLNPAGRALVGLDPRVDIAQVNLLDLLTPQGVAAFLEVEQPAVAASGRWTGESTLCGPAGEPAIPVIVSSFLMSEPGTGEPFAVGTVQRDISERLTVERELRIVAAQRHALLDRLVAAQEEERGRIAADVHDDSVQALAAVDLRLGVLQRRLSDAPTDLQQMVVKLQDTVSGATDRLRNLLFDLEPPGVEVSLSDGLTDAAVQIFEDTPVQFRVDVGPDCELPYAEKVKAVRIAKEAFTNARRHSKARHVGVTVRERRGGVEFAIADDGVGVTDGSVTSRPGHRGLTTMRDQAMIAGGWWRIEGAPGSGTTVRYWLPSNPED